MPTDTLRPLMEAREEVMQAWTREYVQQALAIHGSMRQTAKALGIDRSSLYRLLRKCHILTPPIGRIG